MEPLHHVYLNKVNLLLAGLVLLLPSCSSSTEAALCFGWLEEGRKQAAAIGRAKTTGRGTRAGACSPPAAPLDASREQGESLCVLLAAVGQGVIFLPNCVNQGPSPHTLVSTQVIKQLSNSSDIVEKSQEKSTGISCRVILLVLSGFVETCPVRESKQNNCSYEDKICLQDDVENSCCLDQGQQKTTWSRTVFPWKHRGIHFSLFLFEMSEWTDIFMLLTPLVANDA